MIGFALLDILLINMAGEKNERLFDSRVKKAICALLGDRKIDFSAHRWDIHFTMLQFYFTNLRPDCEVTELVWHEWFCKAVDGRICL